MLSAISPRAPPNRVLTFPEEGVKYFHYGAGDGRSKAKHLSRMTNRLNVKIKPGPWTVDLPSKTNTGEPGHISPRCTLLMERGSLSGALEIEMNTNYLHGRRSHK